MEALNQQEIGGGAGDPPISAEATLSGPAIYGGAASLIGGGSTINLGAVTAK